MGRAKIEVEASKPSPSTNSAKRVGPATPEKRAERIPIMSPEKERFLAFEGLVQWTHAVVVQAARVSETLQHQLSLDLTERRLALGRRHTECNYFAIAANKPLEFKEWTLSFGLCTGVDFSEIDAFSPRDIKDLRNMREHVVDYFKGDGLVKKRWTIETPEYKQTQARSSERSSAEGLTGPHSERRPSGFYRGFSPSPSHSPRSRTCRPTTRTSPTCTPIQIP